VSGVAALLHLDGRPVEPAQLGAMVAMLRRRGPDGEGVKVEGSVGLGHTALHSTPEAAAEPQTLAREGVVVAADARLDNRVELARELALPPATGDTGLIAAAYERWGERCPERLEGDFAFALWDGRERRLVAARDRFGVRPLYLHHQPGRLLALASEPSAILVLPEVPYRINEARIADFLVTQLEGVDLTSTFFEGVERLPPAHLLTADSRGLRRQRYWELTPGPELRLGSDEAYAEAFLEVFTASVRRRLRGAATVGSMLSGGMDSGSIVAVARELRARAGEGPLPVFSAVGPDPATCVETATILAAQAMGGLEPHSVSCSQLDELLPELVPLQWEVTEPFDYSMTLPRAVYLVAQHCGVRAMLDGIDGDTVLGEGSYIHQLMRSVRWVTAWREAVGYARFWRGASPAWRQLASGAFTAIAPRPLKILVRRLQPSADSLARNIATSLISADFAGRIRLGERLEALAASSQAGLEADLPAERARALSHPYVTVGVERYERTAAAVGIEPRHPFLDCQLIELCVALPGSQKLKGGWPKTVLRRAMAGKLPEAVRWRLGKEHLGWAFTAAAMTAQRARLRALIEGSGRLFASYVDGRKLDAASRAYLEHGDSSRAEAVWEAAHLCVWLRRHTARPVPEVRRPGIDLL
jgi:asparagine synthase (glutamine-hydrolysing)